MQMHISGDNPVKPRISNKVFFIVSVVVMMSIFTTAHARRGIEEMKDPVELYYIEPGKITKAQAREFIREAISVSSRPRWIQRTGRQGSIRAEAERGRLFASVDISFDDDGIKINYVDSERMRFRQRKDKKFIRDIYNKWIKSLSKELTRSAQYKYKIKLVSARNRKFLKGMASGKEIVVIAVRALPDTNPKRNGPKWSAQIGESLVDVLNKKQGAKHVFLTLEWNRETQRYVKGGHKRGYNKLACDASESQGVITIGVVVDSTDVDYTPGSEVLTITYFNCETDKLAIKTVDVDYKRSDAFDLQTAITFHVDKFLSETGF